MPLGLPRECVVAPSTAPCPLPCSPAGSDRPVPGGLHVPSLQRPAGPFLLQRPGKAFPRRLSSAPGCCTRRGFLKEEQAPPLAAAFALVSGDACCPLLSGDDEVFTQEPKVGPLFWKRCSPPRGQLRCSPGGKGSFPPCLEPGMPWPRWCCARALGPAVGGGVQQAAPEGRLPLCEP